MNNALRERASVLLIAVTVLGAACTGRTMSGPGPAGWVRLTLNRDLYRSGDTVSAVLKNISNATVDYAGPFCQRALQRYEGAAWVTVSPPSQGCTLEIRPLAPGQSVPLTYGLPGDLPAGAYRLTIPSPMPLNARAPGPVVSTSPFSVNSVTLTRP